MTDLLIDDLTGDLVIENDTFLLTADFADSVKQRLRTRLRTFKGEYFLDLEFGTPYYQQIFVKGISKGVIDNIFKGIITGTPGVVRISSFSSTLDRTTRKYEAKFKAILEDDSEIEDTI
jgi:hypothetical protein